MVPPMELFRTSIAGADMARRFRIVGAGCLVLAVPACVTSRNSNGVDLPPHLSGQPIQKAKPTTVAKTIPPLPVIAPVPTVATVRTQPISIQPVSAQIFTGRPQPNVMTVPPASDVVAIPTAIPHETAKPAIEPIIRQAAYWPKPMPGELVQIPDQRPLPKYLIEDAQPEVGTAEAPTQLTLPPWPEMKYAEPVKPIATRVQGPQGFEGTRELPTPEKPAAVLITPIAAAPKLPEVVAVPVKTVKEEPLPKVEPIPVKEEPKAVVPVAPPAPPKVELPPESPLVKAVRALEQNKTEEAAAYLNKIALGNQEMIANLLQTLVQLSNAKVDSMTGEDASAMMERINSVAEILKSKAVLTSARMCFSSNFFRYGSVEVDNRTEFRVGTDVYLYVEVKNFTVQPAQILEKGKREQSSGYMVSLHSYLELRDANDHVVDRARKMEWDKFFQTAPQDSHQIFKYIVPNLPAGKYTLWLYMTDVPTGRSFRRPIELKIAGPA
jgi:hypothetical protein